jgi:hypothetical protein
VPSSSGATPMSTEASGGGINPCGPDLVIIIVMMEIVDEHYMSVLESQNEVQKPCRNLERHLLINGLFWRF